MSDVKYTNIIPIGIYCFIIAGCIEYWAISSSFSHKEIFSDDYLMWIPLIAATIIAFGLVKIGIGIIHTQGLSWLVLFFFLVTCITCTVALFIAYLILAWLGFDPMYYLFEIDQITPVMWFCFFSHFLSEIIVLYYLCKREVSDRFDIQGPLISPL